MSPRPAALALLALGLLGCNAPPAPAPLVALPSASAAPPAPAESAPPPAKPKEISCDALLAPHRELLQSISAWTGVGVDGFGVCRPTKRGYWVIAFDKVTEKKEPGSESLDVEWSISHVGRDGSRVSRADKARWDYITSASLGEPVLFDYDGDGEEELFFQRRDDVKESDGDETMHFVTFRGGAIVPYAAGKDLAAHAARDVDGDGRPDLLTFAPYIGAGDGSPSGFPYRLVGPEMLARSLPNGDFSRNDAAARAFVKTKCPEKPKVIVPRLADPTEPADAKVALNVVCARIWGAKAAPLVDAIKKHCRPEDKLHEAKAKGQNCGTRKLLIEWAERDPPLSLP